MAELVCGTGDRDAWLAARREGITATDLPVILGLVTWDSPFALYWRKKGKLPEVEATDRMRLGSWLEDQISLEWKDRAAPGQGHVYVRDGGLWRSSDRPWQLATPDRLVWLAPSKGDRSQDQIHAVLECKTSATRDGWGIGDGPENGALSEEFASERSKVPAHVRAQVLWQMDTLGVATGHVAVVFLPSGEFRSYTIQRDDAAEYDIGFMEGAAHDFWLRLQRDDPPPVDGLQVTTDALRFLHAGAVKGKRYEVDAVAAKRYDDLCEEVKAAERDKRAQENMLRAGMGDAQLVVCGDRVVARREIFKRAGYEVGPAEVDRLVRVKPKEEQQ